MSNHHEIKNENYDTNTFMTNHHEIEKEFLIVEKSKTTEDDDEKISHEDMQNSDSISVTDLDQETDVILNQTDLWLNLKELEINFHDSMRLTTEENDKEIFQQDMDIEDSNLVDFDQETDVILTSREIFQERKEDKTEVVEKPKYVYT